MKIAVLSDIHGNFDALSSVLQSKEFLQCELRINLGDAIGYYFEPQEVLNALEKNGFQSVRGNHETFLQRSLDSSEFLESIDNEYGTGLRRCVETFSTVELSQILNWPTTLSIPTNRGLLVAAHGSPISEYEYVYPDSDLNALGFHLPEGTRWLCLGNTHWPMLRHLEGSCILNPGSVGQPRNKRSGAHWAIIDVDNNSVKFIETEYDTSRLISAIKSWEPHRPKLWEIFEK